MFWQLLPNTPFKLQCLDHHLHLCLLCKVLHSCLYCARTVKCYSGSMSTAMAKAQCITCFCTATCSVKSCSLWSSSLWSAVSIHLQAAVRIQKHWRGHFQRYRLVQQHKAAAVVQRHWRGHTQACAYQHTRRAVIRIQSHIRCHQARHRFLRLCKAASCIQVALLLNQ